MVLRFNGSVCPLVKYGHSDEGYDRNTQPVYGGVGYVLCQYVLVDRRFISVSLFEVLSL